MEPSPNVQMLGGVWQERTIGLEGRQVRPGLELSNP